MLSVGPVSTSAQGAASAPPSTPAEQAQQAVVLTLPERAMRGAVRAAPVALAALALLVLATGIELALFARPAGRLWLGLALLVPGLRLAHTLRARSVLPPPAPNRWVPQYLAGLGASALLWAALPWIAFGDAEPAARAVAIAALLVAAFAEALALRAMSRLAVVQAGIVILPAVFWLIGFAERPGWAPAAIGVAGLAVLAKLSLSRDRHLHKLMAAEHEVHRLAGLEAAWQERAGTLEMELARAGTALEMARAERAVSEGRARAGDERSARQRHDDLEKRSLELAREAVTDPLTMLPNRKGINEHLIELLAPMERPDPEGELALLFLDLDKFKDINDQHGHLAGDNVLKVVAERLRECLPRSAFAARWGGDEFIVVLPGLGRVEQVRMVAEKICQELCVPIRLEIGTVRVGCSVGVALAPYHGRTPETLIIAADQAVYAAKVEKKDRVRVFDVVMAKKAQRQHQIAQALPGALERNQLAVFYQPIVNAADGSTSHVEALARWPHPSWGPVSPDEFIREAERNGQIHAMGRWVLRQACLDAARWPGANPPRVSVNVSAAQVSSGRLVSQVREALGAAKLAPHRLVIELTESMEMALSDGISQTLSDLREMGVSLALDDFGTGYSSLQSLRRQPVSLVKIDKSFVGDVPGGGEVLIKATVDVARHFGLDVVAEGVETAAQRSRLESLGVNYMQGYLFGRPMPVEEFVAWLGLRDGSNEPFVLRA
jgi:diguanylate cyclase (GGDEF)-like protein